MPTMTSDPVSIVRAAVKRWAEMLGPNLFGLACSGGVDSMALADAAIEECGAQNVVLIHVDHGLSPGSGRIAVEVTGWARERGVATVIRTVTVDDRASLEAAARDARYAALDAVANEIGCRWVWLAHTARDQAETVLMRIVRGTGPAGLAGIPLGRGHFLRPLLEVGRDVTEAYVAARGLPTWHDPMNDDERFTRVRVRTKLLPMLRAENPAIDQALVRLASASREWLDAIDEVAEPHAKFPMSCWKLIELPAAVRKQAYAGALAAAGMSYEAVHLEAIEALALRPDDGEVSLDVPGAVIQRSYDVLNLIRPGEEAVGSAERELEPPDGYELRAWRPGDRMKPARLKGRSRKLSDLYIDAKVPRALRHLARVVVRPADGAIVWAEHIGLAFGETEAVMPLPSRRGEAF